MWKTIAATLLRCGAIYCVFGVFGIGFFLFKWFYPRARRTK
jgi:hypothetical protein